MFRFPFTVDEAFEMKPPVRVESPETASDVSVPTDVRDELIIPEPRVVEVKTSVLLIWYLV